MIRFAFVIGILFFVLQISYCIDKPDLKFDHISIEDGLSQSVVNCIYKDSYGFVWIATQDGLNKYDGYQFYVYKYDPTNSFSISNNNIFAITEDLNGNLWIGTSGGGINFYDRLKDTFRKISFNVLSDSVLIDLRYIQSLFVDSNNILWIGTNHSGFLCYDIDNEKIIKQKNTVNSNLPCDNINCFLQDDDTMWIGTCNGSVKYELEKDMLTSYFTDYENKDGYNYNVQVLSIAKENKTLWLASWGNGLIQQDLKSEKVIYYLPTDEKQSITSVYLNKIYIDKHQNKWIATWDGLSMLPKGADKFFNWRQNLLIPSSLSNNNLNSILGDEKGMIWIGTWGGGINKFLNKKPAIQHVRKKPGIFNTLTNNSIWTIGTDSYQNIWLGSDEGLTQYNKEQKQFKTYSSIYSDGKTIGDNTVYCILEDSRKVLWIGTWTGGLNRFNRHNETFTRFLPGKDKNSISSDIVNNIIEMSNGKLLISTAKGVNILNTETLQFHLLDDGSRNAKILNENIVLVAYEDHNKNIWIGTDGYGLFHYNAQLSKIERLINDPNNKKSLGSNVIFSIIEDDAGQIWLGTESGLNIYDPGKNIFQLISEKDGLPNDVIYGILKYKNEFWLSTNNGLSRIIYDSGERKIKEIRNFDKSDNLQSTEFNLGAYHKGKDDFMYFGGINGFNFFHPDSIATDTSSLNLVFTDFQLFNESVPLKYHVNKKEYDFTLDTIIHHKKQIELNYHQRIISFEFAALEYKNAQKISYAYKLEGFEEKWNHTDASRRFVTYTNLRPGTYFFKVKGINHQGIESKEQLQIKLIIKPPFWLTVWFYVLVAITAISGLYYYIKRREKVLKNEKLRLEALVSARTNKIMQQKQEMTDSIEYAQRIQNALLPDDKVLSELTNDHFIFYAPKSIVSGDFFWYSMVDDIKVFIVADCTGHGVPGAFMSMLGISFLNKIVNENKITDPALILENLRHNVITSLHQKDTTTLNDGIELAIIAVDLGEQKLTYSGAMNPAYVIQAGELVELRPDTMPISLHFNVNLPFTDKELDYNSNDAVYLFTDGLIDQFGGAQNKRFKSKRLRKILTSIHQLPLSEQKEHIEKAYFDWKGKNEQIDDVLIMGFRL